MYLLKIYEEELTDFENVLKFCYDSDNLFEENEADFISTVYNNIQTRMDKVIVDEPSTDPVVIMNECLNAINRLESITERVDVIYNLELHQKQEFNLKMEEAKKVIKTLGEMQNYKPVDFNNIKKKKN